LVLPVAAVFLFQDYFTTSDVSTVWWIVLVLCIDVSHVYSTLFRFYWDRELFRTHRISLLIIPSVAFPIAALLHFYDPMLFWRILAYVAVFHFVRQQYGFMRIYARNDPRDRVFRFLDNAAIYSATLYPVFYWHLHLTESLSWFVKGDFMPIQIPSLDSVLLGSYLLILAAYITKEFFVSIRRQQFNVPKNLIVGGTYASWYVGIVTFQGDLIFTLLNVVSHGIPYMALVWLYGEKKTSARFSFTFKGVCVFVGMLLLLAYLEEAIWDRMVWNDHPEIFPQIFDGQAIQNPLMLSLIVAILVLPQITHYVIDGFIWKQSKSGPSRT
jgi:hypothetical protein